MLNKVKPKKLAEFLLVSGIAESKEEAKEKANNAFFNMRETEFTTYVSQTGFERMKEAFGTDYIRRGIQVIWNLEGLGRVIVFDYLYGHKTVKVQSVTETNTLEKV